MTPSAAWPCPSCGAANAATPADAAFCSACGEERPGQPPQGWRHTLQRWTDTLRLLAFKPGALTAAYLGGRRKPLVAPLALFLAVNVAFFISQTLSGVAILSIPLSAHLQGQPYSEQATQWVERRASRHAASRDRYRETFDLRQQALAKASVLAMVPPLAAVCALVFWRRRLSLRTHWVFALHYYAFALLLLTVGFPLLAMLIHAAAAAGEPLHWGAVDTAISIVQSMAFGTYASLATRRVYALTFFRRVALAVLLVTVTYTTMLAHRFGVFVVTLWLN